MACLLGAMRPRTPQRYFLLAGFLFFATQAAAQQSDMVRLHGTVFGDNHSIPGASIALIGTTRGAVSNSDGQYSVLLPSGTAVRLRVTALGFKPDTIRITIAADTKRDIMLAVSPISSPLITVTPEDSRKEGERIMREAILAKIKWREKLHTYTLQDYARLNFQMLSDSDSTILSILESEANGYWSAEKGYAEVLTARRQTANLPSIINRASLFRLVDFYDDRIDLDKYSLAGPVAQDAIDVYDFDLAGSSDVNGEAAWMITIKPGFVLTPGFKGTLWISKSDYSLAALDLTFGEAANFGPLEDAHISETFVLVDNTFYLPSELHFSVSAKFQMPLVPKFHLEHVSVMQNYAVNVTIPDSLFTGLKHRVAPGADSTDSASWYKLRTIQLTAKEENAYSHFDSLAKLPPKEDHFDPIVAALGLLINPDVYQYNRIEGSRIQIEDEVSQIGSWPLGFQGLGAYSIGDKRFGYDVTATQALLWNTRQAIRATFSTGDFSAKSAEEIVPILAISGRIHDDKVRIGVSRSIFYNTLTTLGLRDDFSDYYFAHGFDLGLEYTPVRNVDVQVAYRNERQTSIDSVVATYSIFDRHQPFVPNPPINEGRLTSFLFNATYDGRWRGSRLYTMLEGEYASTALGGNFNFAKAGFHIALQSETGGWGQNTMQLHLEEFIGGTPGYQHLYLFETPLDFAGRTVGFFTLSPREFKGDKMGQFYFEQNFYDLPTRIIGLHALDPLHLEWFGIFDIGMSGIMAARDSALSQSISATGSVPYTEAGFGVGNILNLLRVDVAWRLSHFELPSSTIGVRFTIGFTL